jgi:hypothetical protein
VSVRLDLPGQKDGVCPDVRADFHDDVARLDHLAKQVNLALGEFTVQLDRAANVHVVKVVQQFAMPAGLHAIERFHSAQFKVLFVSGMPGLF